MNNFCRKHYVIITTVITLAAYFAASVYFNIGDNIVDNVKIDKVAVGGLSRADGERALSQIKMPQEPFITIICKDKKYYITAKQIDLAIDKKANINQVYAIGRSPDEPYQNLLDIYYTRKLGRSYLPAVEFSREKLQEHFDAVAKELTVYPKNAYLDIDGAGIRIIPEKVGILPDTYPVHAQILDNIYKLKPFSVQISTTVYPAMINYADLYGIDTYLAESSFVYAGAVDDNIRQTIALLDAKLWRNQTSFSWQNDIFTPLGKNAFKDNNIEFNNWLLRAFAQNTAKIGIIPLIYTYEHDSLRVVPGILDYQVRNTTGQDIYIHCYVRGNNVYLEFLGRKIK